MLMWWCYCEWRGEWSSGQQDSRECTNPGCLNPGWEAMLIHAWIIHNVIFLNGVLEPDLAEWQTLKHDETCRPWTDLTVFHGCQSWDIWVVFSTMTASNPLRTNLESASKVGLKLLRISKDSGPEVFGTRVLRFVTAAVSWSGISGDHLTAHCKDCGNTGCPVEIVGSSHGAIQTLVETARQFNIASPVSSKFKTLSARIAAICGWVSRLWWRWLRWRSAHLFMNVPQRMGQKDVASIQNIG